MRLNSKGPPWLRALGFVALVGWIYLGILLLGDLWITFRISRAIQSAFIPYYRPGEPGELFLVRRGYEKKVDAAVMPILQSVFVFGSALLAVSFVLLVCYVLFVERRRAIPKP